MQLPTPRPRRNCIPATQWAVLDWTQLRRTLADYRRAKGLEEQDLGELIGVHKSTVYRIENVDENPDHKPELETIAAWVDATGRSLSELFLTLEGQLPKPTEIYKDAARLAPAPSTPAHEASYGRSVSTTAPAALDDLRLFVLKLSEALASALRDAPDTHRPDAAPRDQQSG